MNRIHITCAAKYDGQRIFYGHLYPRVFLLFRLTVFALSKGEGAYRMNEVEDVTRYVTNTLI